MPTEETRQERRARLSGYDLTQLAQEFKTDKWGLHRYTPHYQRHLEHLRDREFVLLEIGVGGYQRRGRSGRSLRMWKWFFPKARILGLDIEDKSHVDGGRIRTFMGDQSDPAVLQRIVDEEGAPLVVIDDGSHQPAHVRASFAHLFPLLPDDGIYCIEDTQTSYWPEWGGQLDLRARGTSMDLVKDLVDGLNHEEFLLEDYQPSYTDQWVRSVHCYHNLVVVEKGDNREGTNKDQVACPSRRTDASV
ncbi:methyltransferase [Nocardioides gansuensis]|uniref:Methyltransferase n=1 Tax=Nocardioides gansuensis TaxID=2138300 RepID=A0A2T8FFZ0_9ACTN|nr:class I SAM-dependent methyltransferase [Nocardioides gansuensis]PVG84607.1 methyltransferase [Nocardioides gansuensis]